MAGSGNVTVKACGTTLGVIAASGVLAGVPETIRFQGNQALYRYANLTLPYNPNDPGLSFTWHNTNSLVHYPVDAYFLNLLNEPSTVVTVDIGLAGANASGANTTLIDCLNVLDFGAVGDGVTNDTGAIQCALDQAALNWTNQQTAAAQGTTLTNQGSTTVCIPSGYTFLVGGNFWLGPCGSTWGTNGNWVNNPYNVASTGGSVANPVSTGVLNYFSDFFGLGTGMQMALFVRSGVTVQLDGTVLNKVALNAFNGPIATVSNGCFCVFDDRTADLSASNVIIRGKGMIDCSQTGSFLDPAPPPLTGGSSVGVYVKISANFTMDGITVKGAGNWGVDLWNNTTMTLGTGAGAFGPYPTVFNDSAPSNLVIKNCQFLACGVPGEGMGPAARYGAIRAVGSQLTINHNYFNGTAINEIWVAGKDIDVSDNMFDNCTHGGVGGPITISIVDTCTVLRNNIQGGGLDPSVGVTQKGQNNNIGGVGIRIRANATPIKIKSDGYQTIPPHYPIDYTFGVKISQNTVNNFNGFGISADGLPNPPLGFYSNIEISNNTCSNNSDVGIDYSPRIAVLLPVGSDGQNWAVKIGGNILSMNGQFHGRVIFEAPWPTPLDMILGEQVLATDTGGTLYPFGQIIPLNIPAPGIVPYPNVDMTGTTITGWQGRAATPVNGTLQVYADFQVYGETPGGATDGVNGTFTLAHAPAQQFGTGGVQSRFNFQVFVTQTQSVPTTPNPTNVTTQTTPTFVTVNGNVITITPAPPAGSSIKVNYSYPNTLFTGGGFGG